MIPEVKDLSIQVTRLPSFVYEITQRDGAIPYHMFSAFLADSSESNLTTRLTRFQTRTRSRGSPMFGRDLLVGLRPPAATSTGGAGTRFVPRRTRSANVGTLEAAQECVGSLPLRRQRQFAKKDFGPLSKRRRVRSDVSSPATACENGSLSAVSSTASVFRRTTRLRTMKELQGKTEQVRKQLMRMAANVTDHGDSADAYAHDHLGSDSSSSKRSSMNSAHGSGNSSCRSDKNEELDASSNGIKTMGSPRSPLAPLGCGCSPDEQSPRQRSRPTTPRCASSPLESSVAVFPRKRRQRFRLLRSKKVEWDESASQTTVDLEQSPLVRNIGKSRLTSVRQMILHKARQTEPMSWNDLFRGMAKENFVFLGEGDFAEVFRFTSGKQSFVLKLMPAVDDDDYVAPDEIKGYSHFLPEIIASKMVTKLSFKYHNNRTHGFAKLIGMDVVKGRIPRMMLELKSSNGLSVDNSFYSLPSSQEWLVLKYPYMGKSLNSISLLELPAAAMRSIVAQVALSMAAGEHVFQFEHRDLHLGNILIQKVRVDRFRFRVDNENFSVPSEGYVATIIDYSLARVTDEDGEVYYVDVQDDEQDQNEEMPEHLIVHFKTKEMNQNRWDVYNPYSNILWLEYLCKKFRDTLNGLPMGERMRKRNDDVHRAIHSELSVLIDSMTSFCSCSDLVRSNFFFDAFRSSGGD